MVRLCAEARVSTDEQAVCLFAEAMEFANNPWISLPGGTLSGRRDPRICLGVGRPPKTPLN
jgi:hypothetical protein